MLNLYGPIKTVITFLIAKLDTVIYGSRLYLVTFGIVHCMTALRGIYGLCRVQELQ